MKIVVTGSHFTPAQAVIEELKKDPLKKIVYLGRKYTREGDDSLSVESQVLPKLGIKFIPLTTGRLQRSFTFYTIPSLLKIPIGFIQSFYYLIKERPNIVVSFGGYVAVPVVIAAWLLGIPILIHEQTLITGLANKITSWFADKIAVSFESKYSFPKDKIILTGNPMRAELIDSKVTKSKNNYNKPLVYITGGNQGAHIINQTIFEIIDRLSDQAVVIHQTGDSKFGDFETALEIRKSLKNPQNYLPFKWVDSLKLREILEEADLVVTRAGMNTLLELSYFSVPSIVIPLDRHHEQKTNAHFFEKNGLTKILIQEELKPEKMLVMIEQMLKDKVELKKKAQSAKFLVITDAPKRIALEVEILANVK